MSWRFWNKNTSINHCNKYWLVDFKAGWYWCSQLSPWMSVSGVCVISQGSCSHRQWSPTQSSSRRNPVSPGHKGRSKQGRTPTQWTSSTGGCSPHPGTPVSPCVWTAVRSKDNRRNKGTQSTTALTQRSYGVDKGTQTTFKCQNAFNVSLVTLNIYIWIQ